MKISKVQKLAICFGQFGPYHHARVAAVQRLLQSAGEDGGTADAVQKMEGERWDQAENCKLNTEHSDGGSRPSVRVIPVQIAAGTTTYEWKEGNESRVAGKRCQDLRTLCEGVEEEASAFTVFIRARRLFKQERVDVVFVPSYSPARYFALLLAAKSLGCRTVMMNESHAGTERATGWKRWVKKQIVRRFDAALVGGAPHKRHFAFMGIPEEKIFTGYDAVDSDFFASRAREVKKWEMGDGRWDIEGEGGSSV